VRRRSRGNPFWCTLAAHGGRLHESDVAAGCVVASGGRGAEPPRLIAWFVFGLLALLALHVAEPDLPLSGGFAGLRAVCGSVVPCLVAFGVVLALAGLRWPAPDVCPDAMFLPHQLRTGGPGNVRWLLSVPLLQLLYAPLRGHVDADLLRRVVNALFSTLSMLLTLAIAMRLGRSVRRFGLNPGRQTLPLAYTLSLRHAGEVLSTLLLLDGTAMVLLAALPLRSRTDIFLCLLLASGLAFVTWSRSASRLAGLVLEPALATSTVHLFARLNALHLDFARHVADSPFHIPGVPSSVFSPPVRRSVP
jgi:hypothetical protein